MQSETKTVDGYQPNQDTYAGVSTHDENDRMTVILEDGSETKMTVVNLVRTL